MKLSATAKEFYRTILKSKGRFLSILLIVTLGVAFFSGIRSAEPDMRLTADSYFDANRMYDARVMGTLGLTDEDIDEIKRLPLISKCEGIRSIDVLSRMFERDRVIHVVSISGKLNKLTVEKGRLPQNDKECVFDAELMGKSGFAENAISIGDKVTFESGTDEELSDSLKGEEFTVVGFVSTPVYFSFSRGSTTLGTGDVFAYAYVPDSAFSMDYYTEIDYTVKGAKELNCYSDEYAKLLAEADEQISGIKDKRCQARYNKIHGDSQSEIDDAKTELSDADKQLKDAKQKVEDSRLELDSGKEKLEDARKKLQSSKEEAASELKNAKDQLISSKDKLARSKEELSSWKKSYEDGQKELANKQASYENGLKEYNDNVAYCEKLKAQRNDADEALSQLEAGLDSCDAAILQTSAQLDSLNARYEAAIQASATDEELNEILAAITQTKSALDAINTQKEELNTALEQTKTGIGELDKQIPVFEDGLLTAKATLDEGKKQLDDAALKLDMLKNELDKGEKELANGQAKLDEGWNTYYLNEKKVNSSLEQAQQQITDGESEIRKNEQKLDDANKEIADGEKEVEENRQKLEDAQKKLDDIKYPEWYRMDRMDDTDYAEYDDNAERIRRIGQVFPAIFFLVAALISLTTMTRMVEEERGQIGLKKALGYLNGQIIAKYVGYAAIATLSGSVIGVLLGEKIFPRVIMTAYGIMYHYMKDLLTPYNPKYAALAGAIAVLCVLFATIYACYKELRAVPAQLLRPPSPKNGKRIFLERITFIWRALSFSWKASVRNLSRYKKRLIMTVFGIGGSMALVLAGFGLQNSIMEVVTLQYEDIQNYDADVYLKDDISDDDKEALFLRLDSIIGKTGYMQSYMKSVTAYGDGKDDGSDRKGNETKSDRKDKDNAKSVELYLFVPEYADKLPKFLNLRDRMTHEPYELNDDSVVITEKAATLLGIREGDDITLEPEDGESMDVKVSAICENYMYHYVYMTPLLYEKLTKEEPTYNNVMVSTKKLKTQDMTLDEANSINEEIGEEILSCDGIMTIRYLINTKDRLDDMLGTLNIVIVVLIISAGLLSFVVLYNLNTINITERRRELATIKLLGFYDTELAMYVYRENMILTVIGVVLGIILGAILHRFLITTVEIDVVMFGRHAYVSSYIYSILITIGFSGLVNWMMLYKLRKIDMVESLKSVE